MASPRSVDASYPPTFRHAISTPPIITPAADSAGAIPVIDLDHLDTCRLSEACREWGVFLVVNHGLPPAISERLHAEARAFFSLPFEAKQAGAPPPSRYFWGSPRLFQSVKNLNWVEGLHFTFGELRGGDSSFGSLLYNYGQQMTRITRMLLDAMSIDLKLDTKSSASYLSDSDATLRVYRYLSCSFSNCIGLDAHTDSSIMSILNQDQVEGLQILHNGRWCNLPPAPGTLIVNLGDMMQAISNDQYRSVEHRVVTNTSRERISLCYFAFPPDDHLILSSNYKVFNYREFKARVEEDINEFGCKVGLPHFKKNRASNSSQD